MNDNRLKMLFDILPLMKLLYHFAVLELFLTSALSLRMQQIQFMVNTGG